MRRNTKTVGPFWLLAALVAGFAGEAADVNLDSLSLAFYSELPGSLPDCRPAAKP